MNRRAEGIAGFVRRITCGDEEHPGQSQLDARCLRQGQMAIVRRVKRATQNAETEGVTTRQCTWPTPDFPADSC
jgi:hypothetical protein